MRGCLITLGVVFLLLIAGGIAVFLYRDRLLASALDNIFASIDADRNGSLTEAEFHGGLSEWFPQGDGYFQALDSDASGTVDAAEFSHLFSMWQKVQALASEDVTEGFAALDSDGNGSLSVEELRASGLTAAQAQTILERFDSDKTGTLDSSEFGKAREDMRGMLPAGSNASAS